MGTPIVTLICATAIAATTKAAAMEIVPGPHPGKEGLSPSEETIVIALI